MPQLHETGYGRKLFERDLPGLVKGIQVIGEELKRANDLKEKELEFLKEQSQK